MTRKRAANETSIVADEVLSSFAETAVPRHAPTRAAVGLVAGSATARGCASVRDEPLSCASPCAVLSAVSGGAAVVGAAVGAQVRSVIILDDPPGPGPSDTIDDVAWMFAEALCATLVIPSPCRMLGGYGNEPPPPCLNDSYAVDKSASVEPRGTGSWARYLNWGEKSGLVMESNVLVASSPEMPYNEKVA